MKHLKLPCQFSKLSQDEDKRLLKCKLRVQHDKDNPNGSYFDQKDIENVAEKSLRNTPILGSVIYDEELEEYRLNGHDMDYEIVHGEDGLDLKIRYIERIYGFIPNDAPIWYEEEDNRNYLCTFGYLWKNYLDEVKDILERNDNSTDVSMEIEVNDFFEREDGLLQITDYVFNGITMLGVQPGMIGANLQLFSKNMSEFKLAMDELYKTYSLEKEEDVLEENITNEAVEQVQEVIETTEVEVENLSADENDIAEAKVDEVVEEPINAEFEQLQEKYNLAIQELENLKTSYSELEDKLNAMQDYAELKEFKENYDKAKYEKEIEDASKLFDLDEEEIKDLKDKAMNKEITVAEFEKELGFMFAMKVKDSKPVEKTKTNEVQVFDNVDSKYEPYGGLFKKYL